MPTTTTTRISSGALLGTSEDGVDRYLGVPYAAAPAGEHRFALAAPHPGWEGVRDAAVMGATSPQAPYRGAFAELMPTVIIDGDESLNVNVWAPSGAKDLPVMVWVHGGADVHGSNSLDGYDGTAFARDGVVLVSINYRLGVEGFSVLDGVPLDLGLTDVMAALRWVREEVRAFGGDPDRVMAFGESAGSILLGSVLAHPDARGLIARAILQSGVPTAVPVRSAAKITGLIAKRLGIPATKEAFAARTPAELIAAQEAVMAGGTPVTGGPSFQLAIGGDAVPRDPLQAVLGGAGDRVELLIGSNAEEPRLWFVPLGLMDSLSAPLFLAARLRFRITRRILKAYRQLLGTGARGPLFSELVTDLVVRLPINRIADGRLRRGATTWVYEFAWSSPSRDLGAAHAMELGFVFDTLASPDWAEMMGARPPQDLAEAMHAAWVRFATTGDPGWEAWDASRPVQTFDSPTSAVVHAPREATRAVWKR